MPIELTGTTKIEFLVNLQCNIVYETLRSRRHNSGAKLKEILGIH